MSQNSERGHLSDALYAAASGFEPPDAVSLHAAAVRRGRQIRRRRRGAALAGTVALGAVGVLAFTAVAGAGRGPVVSAASGGVSASAAAPAATATPTLARPTAPPTFRGGVLSGPALNQALEYALPSDAVVLTAGGFTDPNLNTAAVDPTTHSWYAQTAVTIKSPRPQGTLVSISVQHTSDPDTCKTFNRTMANGAGTCTQTTVDGGKLLEVDIFGVMAPPAAFEYFEWFSPAGYQTNLQLQDATFAEIALTKSQGAAILTSQALESIAEAMPGDACVGGTLSAPVDPPTPGQSPLQHRRCSTDGQLYPSY